MQPTVPESLGDFVRAIKGRIENGQIEQPAVSVDLGDRQRDGQHEGRGKNVLPFFRQELRTVAGDGGCRGQDLRRGTSRG